MEKENLRDILMKIQSELSVPKNQVNNFGHYNYRSCEDILEALKPILKKYNCLVKLDDEVVNIGDRYYVKATAWLMNHDMEIKSTAYAREELDKKGMDGSQITGSSSSYARKYALNGLFGIDDTKDSDTTNKGDKSERENGVKTTNTDEVVREPIEKSKDVCSICGEKLVFRTGTNKNGKTWKGYFCPNKDQDPIFVR